MFTWFVQLIDPEVMFVSRLVWQCFPSFLKRESKLSTRLQYFGIYSDRWRSSEAVVKLRLDAQGMDMIGKPHMYYLLRFVCKMQHRGIMGELVIVWACIIICCAQPNIYFLVWNYSRDFNDFGLAKTLLQEMCSFFIASSFETIWVYYWEDLISTLLLW